MQFFFDGVDLDTVRLQTGWIIAGLDGDGIMTQLSVRQVMEKQGALMGEYRLCTAEVQQIHSIRPRIGQHINSMCHPFCPTLLGVGIERRLGNAVFQNLRSFENAVVLPEK